MLQQKRGVGDLEAGVDRGCKPNFTPLSLELNPRAKKDGSRLKRVEVDGKCWLERQYDSGSCYGFTVNRWIIHGIPLWSNSAGQALPP